ncbi:MAG: ABC transporter permease [Thermoflexales bacterium]|nr:ABC transporter permease [Thermoflexales bacterium]
MLFETLRVALRAITANKLRSALTTLGIVIGVMSVISLVAMGSGVQQLITRQFEAQGTNLVFVIPMAINTKGGEARSGAFNTPGNRNFMTSITENDVIALRDRNKVPDARLVVPTIRVNSKVYAGLIKTQTSVRGTTYDFPGLQEQKLVYGAWWEPTSDEAGARVAVLGNVAYRKLFPGGGDPTGADIRIDSTQFKVVGVVAQRSSGTEGSDDDVISVPFATARDRLQPLRNARGERLAGFVLIEAETPERIPAVIAQATEVLRQRHNIEFNGEDDFSIASSQDIQGTFSSVTGIVTIFLAVVAGISLFVGGIGIMNIMLVSVTERTREIGLRKAIGAKRGVILVQFLFEAALIGLLGGLTGVALGWAVATLVAVASNGLFQSIVSIDSVLIAVGFSALVGVVFGVYPAWRAAGLNPIDALRYE